MKMIENRSFFSQEELEENVLLVKLCGEIDHHSAVRMRSELDELIVEKRPKKMILDLSQIGFMDSSGLGLIMGRCALIGELGGRLVLKDPSEAIMKIIRLAGMDKTVKIEKEGEKKNESK